jgi:hypothetical protein
LGIEERDWNERLRLARDAEKAHLDAVLRINGASYLRLAHLRNALADALPGHMNDIQLKAEQGEEPMLWLDLAHCVTMSPDPKTYHLAFRGRDGLQTLLQTKNFAEVIAASEKVLAHAGLRQSRMVAGVFGNTALRAVWPQATLVYVWLTGLVTGAATVALFAIYLKKLPFFG